MISLKKQPRPQILTDNGSQWTIALMSYVNQGIRIPDHIKGRYRHADIKSAVTIETNGKCAYCEAFVSHQYPGDIEHIIPKSVYPRLTFLWNNLSFVCYWCNNNKSNSIDKTCKILNPYADTIIDHLRAFGPIILHVNDSKRGELTHLQIKLNRKELIERRTDAIKSLQNLIDKYERETVIVLKNILKQEIIDSSSAEKEFSFYLTQYLKDRNII